MQKRLTSGLKLILAVVCLGLIFVCPLRAHAVKQISTLEQLQAMKDDLTASYELVNDIDASDTRNWNSGAGFVPVGDYDAYFTGSFNGNGHVIRNLYINRPDFEPVGLFGCASGPIFSVGLINATVTGDDSTGALAGYSSGNITDCWSTGTVTSVEYWGGGTGGLVGKAWGPTLSGCYSTAAVSGVSCIGGLVGHALDGSYYNCYSTGSVTASSSSAGGFIGDRAGACNLYNCYSAGAVSSPSAAGGLTGDDSSYGGTDNCFWDTETSGQTTSGKGTGKSTAAMKTKSTFTDAGWDFTTRWDIHEGVSYPFLVKVYYQDADADGYGNAAVSLRATSAPTGYVTDSTDCDDTNPALQALSTYYRDADADGYGDASSSTSVCSLTAPTGYVTDSTDCMDNNASVNPAATEICGDLIDNDCNGKVDEGCSSVVLLVGPDWSGPHYPDINSAVNEAADGAEIWVEKGTYALSSTITISNAIGLYGGFTGSEPSRDQRSTDAGLTIIDGNNSNRCILNKSTATIDGFTVTRGYYSGNGGGISNGVWGSVTGDLTLSNCNITTNRCSTHVGGVLNDQGSMTVTNCTFTGNAGNNMGGALGTFSPSTRLTVTGCVFTGNYANHSGAIRIGGGTGANTITDCVFTGNQALMATKGDGAVILCDGNVTINRCIFNQNTGTRYGIVAGYGDSGTSIKLINSLFTGNTTGYGGAICISGYQGNLGTIEVTNCTITGNTATSGYGGAIYTRKPSSDSSSVFAVTNSIIWGNTGTAIDRSGTTQPLPTVSYSDLDQTGYAGTISDSINSDPLFTDAANGVYTLQSTSPCLNTGTTTGAPADDILKVSRPQGSGIDMGAYEAAEEFTAITLASFVAVPGNGKVILKWETGDETGNFGFNVYRSDTADGEYVKINSAIIASSNGSGLGGVYGFVDNSAENRKPYYYKLEDMDVNGVSTFHGPVSATPRLIYGLTGK